MYIVYNVHFDMKKVYLNNKYGNNVYVENIYFVTCPGMGILLEGRIPLPGHGHPCLGRGVHILFLNQILMMCNDVVQLMKHPPLAFSNNGCSSPYSRQARETHL